ncbi:hypothetical protein LEP1GSC193_3660 [Leptospira alstonii serovar Pingchang str. 80-412]|uniref:Uncharacterized protein n=2 Tax=Leptospira alstonii TaxID=28452 RepID=M6CUP7_9LEPT|nr:hypothetical protein LEP1GSC194_3410 [Leptospira alstonii serovar Sichuan str. 79601]EQA81312.1 hypothetical protein LEP1GSC193_3660 [Leptospira alstonii serovar Pingchang str. 80-412]
MVSERLFGAVSQDESPSGECGKIVFHKLYFNNIFVFSCLFLSFRKSSGNKKQT